jgi:hypothetical protein
MWDSNYNIRMKQQAGEKSRMDPNLHSKFMVTACAASLFLLSFLMCALPSTVHCFLVLGTLRLRCQLHYIALLWLMRRDRCGRCGRRKLGRRCASWWRLVLSGLERGAGDVRTLQSAQFVYTMVQQTCCCLLRTCHMQCLSHYIALVPNPGSRPCL